MEKVKVVIDVKHESMDRAIEIAESYPGVESACFGHFKKKLKVIGEDIDADALTASIEKEVGYAKLEKVKEIHNHNYGQFVKPVTKLVVAIAKTASEIQQQ